MVTELAIYSEWLKAIDQLATANGYSGSYTINNVNDSWIIAFEDGVTPEELWQAEHRV